MTQLCRKLEYDPARPRNLLTDPWVGYRVAGLEILEPAPPPG
jgi:hypothetical protein